MTWWEAPCILIYMNNASNTCNHSCATGETQHIGQFVKVVRFYCDTCGEFTSESIEHDIAIPRPRPVFGMTVRWYLFADGQTYVPTGIPA